MNVKLLEPTMENTQPDLAGGYNDLLIEKLWHDLDGQLSREVIVMVVKGVADRFRDVSVRAFVPIFIRRQALEELKWQLEREAR